MALLAASLEVERTEGADERGKAQAEYEGGKTQQAVIAAGTA